MDRNEYNVAYDHGWNDALEKVFREVEKAGGGCRVLNIISGCMTDTTEGVILGDMQDVQKIIDKIKADVKHAKHTDYQCHRKAYDRCIAIIDKCRSDGGDAE
jgi:hypothetical protein